jgi:predicted GNAT superfamily acetyltransferase
VIEIRDLQGVEEAELALRLQREVWGFQDVELVPKRVFVVAQKIGGHALGAFDDGQLVGFALAIPGRKPSGAPYLHSHMVGVAESHRNQGVGRQLKWAQRQDALGRKFDLMEWTFDPLQLKNASFNLQKLGAVIRRYVLNQYGITTSHLQGGLPTDRCVAEWWMNSDRVQVAESGQKLSLPQDSEIKAKVAVPLDILEIRSTDFERAKQCQSQISEQFLENFDRGLAVTGFQRTDTEGIYLFTSWPQ